MVERFFWSHCVGSLSSESKKMAYLKGTLNPYLNLLNLLTGENKG